MSVSTLLVWVLSGVAQGAGYYFSDIGVRSFSRGGAFVAGADDLTALYYNPGALTRISGGQVMLDMAGVGQSVYFDRDDYPGATTDGGDLINDPIENQAKPFLIPHFGVANSFGLPNTTFAFGFYPPYAPDYSYPADGAQRYNLIDTMVIQTVLGPTVAHRFADWVSVGVGIYWATLVAEQQLKISLYTVDLDGDGVIDAEPPEYDVGFELRTEDWFELSGNIGVLIEPPDKRWAVGFTYQPPIEFDTEGYMAADFSENFYHKDIELISDAESRDDTVYMVITMPTIIKAGGLVRPTDNSEIEVAFVWEGWKVVEEFLITDVDMVVGVNSELFEDIVVGPEVILPASYLDAWSVRLGGEIDAFDTWTFRAGGLYETAAIPESTQGISLVDGVKFGYGAGLTKGFGHGLDLDLGWFQSFIRERQLEGTEVYAIAVDPLSGEISEGRVVSDGLLRANITFFGAGVVWNFGPQGDG